MLTAEPLGRHEPLAREPRRREQRRQHRLRPVAEQQPAKPGAERPEQEAARPVFLQIEDLAREEDPAAERDRAAGVQRGG